MTESILDPQQNSSAAIKPFKVNLYAFATAIVSADTHKNAAKLVINSPMTISNLSCGDYQCSWSENDVMVVGVTKVLDPYDICEFEYASLIETPAFSIQPEQAITQFEVFFYFNIELIVTDANNEDEAIQSAKSVNVFGDLSIANPAISIDYEISDCVEPSIVDSKD